MERLLVEPAFQPAVLPASDKHQFLLIVCQAPACKVLKTQLATWSEGPLLSWSFQSNADTKKLAVSAEGNPIMKFGEGLPMEVTSKLR